MRLSVFDKAPVGLEDLEVKNVRDALTGPSLIYLPGRKSRPIFVSVLLHGNETTSWTVAQKLIAISRREKLKRPILLFIGNVPAAAAGKRYLPGQLDYNRIWSGGEHPENALATETLGLVRAANPFAAIDIHNNTGANPLYSCVSRLEPSHLHLASLFSPLAVYYTNPSSALSIACSDFAPSVAVECGVSGEPAGIERALTLIDAAMALDEWRADFGGARDIDLYHTLGRIFLDESASFSFDGSPADAMISPEIEDWNFRMIGEEAVWARSPRSQSPLRVVNEMGADITDSHFAFRNGETRLVAPAVPAMLSKDKDNARLDCLGYLMEPISLGDGR